MHAIQDLAPTSSLFTATQLAVTLADYLRNANDEPAKVRLLPQMWTAGNELNPILKPLYVSILHTLLSSERNSHIKAQIIAEFRRILHEEPTALDASLSTSLFTTLRQIIANHNPREADVVVDFSYGCLMKLIPQRRSVLGPRLLQTFAEVAATTLSQPQVAAQYLDINCVVVASILESCDDQSSATIVSICINAARLFHMITSSREHKIEDVVLIRLASSVIRCFTAVLRWPILPPFISWKPSFYRSISSVLISCLLSGVDSVATAGSALLAQAATTAGQYLQFFVGDFSLYFLISVARLLHPARLKFPQFAKQMQAIRELEEEKQVLADSAELGSNASSNGSVPPAKRSPPSKLSEAMAMARSSNGGSANLRNSLFGDELTPGDPIALPSSSYAQPISPASNSPLSTVIKRGSSPEPDYVKEEDLPCAAILEDLYSHPTTAERLHRLTKDMLLPELAFLADYPVSIVSLTERDDTAYGQFQTDLWNALNVTRSALCHILLCLIHVRGRTQQQLVELMSLWYDRMSFSGHFILVDVLNKALMSILVKADGQSVPLILGLTSSPASSPSLLRTSLSSSAPLLPLNASSSPHSSAANIAAVTGTTVISTATAGPSIPAFPSAPGSPSPHALPLTSSEANQNELKKRIADMERELTHLTSERADMASQLAEQGKTIHSINTEKEALLNQIACAVCFENILDNKPVCLDCGHLFCGSCVDKMTKTHKNCPLCKSEIGKIILVKGL